MYSDWIRRALEFVNALALADDSIAPLMNVAPCLTRQDLDTWQESEKRIIPNSYSEFLQFGASSCQIAYVFNGRNSGESIYGAIKFCSLDEISAVMESLIEFGEWLCEIGQVEVGKVWQVAFPFSNLGNGDFLAFDLTSGVTDPPVIYLSHDEFVIRKLASSLSSFLTEWEKLNYLGPAIWKLEDFIDSSGLLSVNPESTKFKKFLLEFPSRES